MSQVDDIKVRLKVTIIEDDAALDISTATVKSIIFQKPDGTILTKTATFLTDGTDGIIYYDTIAGDLDQSGIYKVQGAVSIGSGSYKGSKSTFKVECNLE